MTRDNKINVEIEVTHSGDGAKQAAVQINALSQSADSGQKAFENYQKQADAVTAALKGLFDAGGKSETAKKPAALNELLKGLETIENKGLDQFASGVSKAFVSFVSGAKSADDAFKEFAGNFMKSIAEMITQLLVLVAVKAALRGLGIPLAEGGMAAAPAAVGGMFPVAAATGVMLAASGLQGVDEINGPTYFPQFNVLAGEAGREVMTVMARPQLGSVDGMPVMLGSVGPEKLAIISQENLSRMVHGGGRATFAASGHISGGAGETGLSVSRQTNRPDGRIVVELTPHPAYETRIIENSIAGARVAVATDLATDTPIRQQVKGVLS